MWQNHRTLSMNGHRVSYEFGRTNRSSWHARQGEIPHRGSPGNGKTVTICTLVLETNTKVSTETNRFVTNLGNVRLNGLESNVKWLCIVGVIQCTLGISTCAFAYCTALSVLLMFPYTGTGGSFRNKSHGGPSVYSVDGETLRINQVSKRHMGVYYCIASNGVPPSVSKRVAVTVLCKFIRPVLTSICVSFILRFSEVCRLLYW